MNHVLAFLFETICSKNPRNPESGFHNCWDFILSVIIAETHPSKNTIRLGFEKQGSAQLPPPLEVRTACGRPTSEMRIGAFVGSTQADSHLWGDVPPAEGEVAESSRLRILDYVDFRRVDAEYSVVSAVSRWRGALQPGHELRIWIDEGFTQSGS